MVVADVPEARSRPPRDYPRRGRGGAAIRRRNIHAAAAAAPRFVGERSTSRPRRRRDSSEGGSCAANVTGPPPRRRRTPKRRTGRRPPAASAPGRGARAPRGRSRLRGGPCAGDRTSPVGWTCSDDVPAARRYEDDCSYVEERRRKTRRRKARKSATRARAGDVKDREVQQVRVRDQSKRGRRRRRDKQRLVRRHLAEDDALHRRLAAPPGAHEHDARRRLHLRARPNSARRSPSSIIFAA